MSISNHKAKWAAVRKGGSVATANTGSIPDQDDKPSGTLAVYSIWKSQVKADWDRLKAEPDHAERDRQKPALVQRYWEEYLQGWIASGETHQNDVLAVVLVWAADVPECRWLMELVDAAVATACALPKWLNFKSELLTHVSDTIRNRAEQVYKASQQGGEDGAFKPFHLPDDFQGLFGRVVAGDLQINFVSVAKFNKLAGLEAESHGDWQRALACYQAANEYPNVAVKGRLENAAKMVESLVETPLPQATGETTGEADFLLAESAVVTPGKPVLT